MSSKQPAFCNQVIDHLKLSVCFSSLYVLTLVGLCVKLRVILHMGVFCHHHVAGSELFILMIWLFLSLKFRPMM